MTGMVSHPVETTSQTQNPFRQYLKGFAGVPVTATDVKVYRVLKNGKQGKRVIRIEDKTGKTIKKIGGEHDK